MTKSSSRTKQTGEIFTPHTLVTEILSHLKEEFDPANNKNFLDPACGDGEFLRGVVRQFLTNSKSPWKKKKNLNEQHLIDQLTCTPIIKDKFNGQIFGVDLMWDNVCDSLYFLLTTVDADEEINSEYRNSISGNRIDETGFESASSEDLIPEQINDLFTGTRIYNLPNNRKLSCKKINNHHIVFNLDDTKPWLLLTHVVRANSLTEWIFKEWKPGHVEIKEEAPSSEAEVDLRTDLFGEAV